jgi:hypothetical protein
MSLASLLRCKALEEQMWNFEVLGIREARNAAASAARKADVVAVSVSGQLELPGMVQAWFDMWLWLLQDENPALIALFDSSTTPNIAPIRVYLSVLLGAPGANLFGRIDRLFCFQLFEKMKRESGQNL